MNKLTTTLAGLALVAGASIAPAFAQGAFSDLGTTPPFVFSFIGTGAGSSFSAISQAVNYNALGTTGSTPGFLTLTGGAEIDGSVVYQNTNLSFSTTKGGPALFTDVIGLTTVVPLTGGNYSIASVNASASGNQYNLTAAPVPEASTVISFGALLALGGLAVLRRKSVAKNAA